jgi:hypothetical protein
MLARSEKLQRRWLLRNAARNEVPAPELSPRQLVLNSVIEQWRNGSQTKALTFGRWLVSAIGEAQEVARREVLIEVYKRWFAEAPLREFLSWLEAETEQGDHGQN